MTRHRTPIHRIIGELIDVSAKITTAPSKIRRVSAGIVVILLTLMTGAAGAALAAPAANLWARWQAHDPRSSRAVDHDAWGRLLAIYVVRGADGANRFRYGAVGVADSAALDDYLARLGKVAVSGLAKGRQFAYWINLYNALTVRLVLDNYPVASILDIGGGLFTSGPWRRKIFAVEGVRMSLDDIEHRILRPIWRDPRIHYALNCAAAGCPDLMERPFTQADMEEMLNAAARRFINHPRGVRIEEDRLAVSSLFVWYREDFGGGDEDVISHLRAHARPELANALSRLHTIDSHGYDWSLNDFHDEPGASVAKDTDYRDSDTDD